MRIRNGSIRPRERARLASLDARWTSFTKRTTGAARPTLRPKPGTSRSTERHRAMPTRRIRRTPSVTRGREIRDRCYSRRSSPSHNSQDQQPLVRHLYFGKKNQTAKETALERRQRRRRSRTRRQRAPALPKRSQVALFYCSVSETSVHVLDAG